MYSIKIRTYINKPFMFKKYLPSNPPPKDALFKPGSTVLYSGLSWSQQKTVVH